MLTLLFTRMRSRTLHLGLNMLWYIQLALDLAFELPTLPLPPGVFMRR